LTEPIQAGVRYKVSFHASLADKFNYAVGSLGAHFSDTLITRTSFNSLPGVEPDVQSPEGVVMSDKDIWYHITDTFVSRYGGERFLTIGNFKSTAESDTLFLADNPIVVPTEHGWDTVYQRLKSYYYIDDVSVIALDSMPNSIGNQETLKVSIFPNPATDAVQIQGQGLTAVRLMDISGRVILEENIVSDRHTVRLESVPPGLYLIEVRDAQGRRQAKKLVVQ
jgi:hypothetical protein